MILFSLFYFVPENENDMLSGFGLFRGGIVHFWRKKGISAQREAGIVHFKKEKRISAKSISIKKMHRNGRLEQRRSRYHVL